MLYHVVVPELHAGILVVASSQEKSKDKIIQLIPHQHHETEGKNQAFD